MYQVSDLGRVRSLDRVVPDGRGFTKRLKGRALIQTNAGTNRYLMVMLSKESKHKNCTVHTLVAKAFLGPCPVGMEVLHGDEGALDNHLSNLRWGTRSENQLQRAQDGTQTNRPVRREDGREFTSPLEAQRLTGVQASSIRAVCSKYLRPPRTDRPNSRRRFKAGGVSWEFI